MQQPPGSIALLVGTSAYDDDSLPALPQVESNVARLKSCLTDSRIGGWHPDDVHIVLNANDESVVGEKLEEAAQAATGTLLIYIAGHGLIGRRRELYLAVKRSRLERPGYLSLPAATIRSAVAESPAHLKLIIADCCYSGRFLADYMGSSEQLVADQLDTQGSLTLVSCAADVPALAPTGEAFTAFTGELISVLESGDPEQPSELSLRAIFSRVRNRLRSRGFPEPRMVATECAADAPFARNLAYRLGGLIRSSQRSSRVTSHLAHNLDTSNVNHTPSGSIERFLEAFTGSSEWALDRYNMKADLGQLPGSLVGMVERCLATAAENERRGIQPPPDSDRLAIDAVETILISHPEASNLRFQLAKFLGASRDYDGAVVQISKLASNAGRLRTSHLMFAAEMLMNLCQFDDTHKLLSVTIGALTAERANGGLVGPITEDDICSEMVIARSFDLLWIPNYRGNRHAVLRNAETLLPYARELGRRFTAGILHRIGRAEHEIAFENRDRPLLEKSLTTLETARAAAGSTANPHAYMAEYYTRKALDLPGAEHAWRIATEQFQGWPESMLAHQWLAVGRRARRETPLAAVESLQAALEVWASHPYPSGACDAMIELGLVHSEFGSRKAHLIALKYFATASVISSRLGLLQQDKAQKYLDRCGLQLNVDSAKIGLLLNDAASQWPVLFASHGLHSEKHAGLLSIIEPSTSA